MCSKVRRTLACFLTLFLTLSILKGFGEERPLGMSGVGLYVSFGGSATGKFGPGVGLLLSWKEAPLIGVTWSLLDKRQSIGAFADFWIHRGRIEQTPLQYYLGGGGYGGFSFEDSDVEANLGIRVPVGVRFLPNKNWEVFLQFVPKMEILPELGLSIGAELGGKYNF
ncbi:MAG: hypothetical protein SNJ78_06770 [Spirochaetales bacterium]